MTANNVVFSPFAPTQEELSSLVREDLEHVQQAIQSNLELHLPFLGKVLQYIIESYRLPLRSIALSLSARMFGYSGESLRHVASVLEYLYTASMLHQNIVITEEFRRHQKEMGNIWGNEASVLLGDYLLSVSFQTMTHLGDFDLMELVAATTQGIARGQVLEISPLPPQRAEAHYLEMMQNKRASLFAAAAKSGGILGKADATTQAALYDYGRNLGLAFQLKEDCISLQDADWLYKRLQERRLIFPVCHLIQKTQGTPLQGRVEQLVSLSGLSAQSVQDVQGYLLEHETYVYTRQRIQGFLESARQAIKPLTHLDTQPLLQITEYALLELN